ncbi:MAG TPA: hypothetical protein VGW78_00215 [Candidatus Babeliales bacterium]|jgi:hypothetical protein|nr:hypothetical protein [Candidatus Babeliales bacterium]
MVITQATANFLVTTITLLCAYSIIVTISNFVHAWFARKMGDDTPAQLGFLSLNPLDHIDPIGLICIVFFQFGWGQYIPINPSNLYGKWYKTKVICTLLAGSVVYILMALISLFVLICLFDPFIIALAQGMVGYTALSFQILTQSYPLYPSYLIAIGFILIAIMYFGVILGVLNGIINCFYAAMILWHTKPPHLMTQNATIALLLAPILLILFLSGPLRMFIIYVLSYSGYLITHLLGWV